MMFGPLLKALLLSLISPSFCGNIGIGFSTDKPYDVALAQLKARNVYIFKTWDIRPDLLDQMEITYAKDSLDVTVAIENYNLSAVANNDQIYLNFVREQLVKHQKIIKLVAVGNEPYLPENRAVAMPYILNAFHRIVKLVADNGLANSIKVTIPFSSDILTNTYPVANAVFHPDVINLMKNVTTTMMATGSKFSINLYPYFDYAYTSQIPLETARGSSQLDADFQACRNALIKIGAKDLPIIIGETGWPSSGDEIGIRVANVTNMQTYIQNTINYVRSSNLIQTAYLFEAYDESWKPAGVEQHWGLYTEKSRIPKFALDISSYGANGGVGSVIWNGNNWALNCGFPGNDLISVQGIASACGGQCLVTSGCTHYTWTPYNGGTCWMKTGAVSKSDAIYNSAPGFDFVCGVNPNIGGGPVNWNGNNWAQNCDFSGYDLWNVQAAASACGSICLSTSGCTHYTWTSYNGGTCWLKKGSVSKTDAYFVLATPNYVCGVNPYSGGEAVNWNGNDWALNCDFPGNDLSNVKGVVSACGGQCLQTPGCTHFTWTSYNGGTCWMKKGVPSKRNAIYNSTPNYVCGVNPNSVVTINWSGKWANACYFKGGDIAYALIPGQQCSNKCATTSGCTHYTWTSLNGGTCSMKNGIVSLLDAFVDYDQSMVCGIL